MPRYTTGLQEGARCAIERMLPEFSNQNRVHVERSLLLRRNIRRKETSNKNYVRALLAADRALGGKALGETTPDDLLKVVAHYRQMGEAGSVHGYCVLLSAHLKELRGLRSKDALPRELDDILRVPRGRKASPGYPIIGEEWKALLEVVAEPGDYLAERDLTMLWVGWDVGFRPSEEMSLTWAKRRWIDKEVGTFSLVEGEGDLKTGPRSEPTAFSHCAPQLKVWEELHGASDVPSAPMWPAFESRPTGQPLTYQAWYKRFKAAAERAGIVVPGGKGLRPHDLRHTAASRDAIDLNFPEAALMAKYGWNPGSKEMATYIHMRSNYMQERARQAARQTHGVSPTGFLQPTGASNGQVDIMAQVVVKAMQLLQQPAAPAPNI